MIPDTFGALLALLGLVAPGLVYELRRERRRPATNASAFREASRVALSSFVFTASALVILGIVRIIRPSWVVDGSSWISEGASYASANLVKVGVNGIVVVALAVLLALATEYVVGRKTAPTIQSGGLWFYIFKVKRPANSSNWVSIGLKSGDRVFGYVDRFSVTSSPEEGELYVVGPDLTWIRATAEGVPSAGPLPLSPDWDGVHVTASEIAWLRVAYKPRTE